MRKEIGMDIITNQEPMPKEKTAKEKLQETLDSLNEYQQNLSFIDILHTHFARNSTEFHAAELSRILKTLEFELYIKILHLMSIADVAEERSTYLKRYLEGKMFTSEEAAREALPMEIKNAQAILDECKKRWL